MYYHWDSLFKLGTNENVVQIYIIIEPKQNLEEPQIILLTKNCKWYLNEHKVSKNYVSKSAYHAKDDQRPLRCRLGVLHSHGFPPECILCFQLLQLHIVAQCLLS